MNWRQSAKAAEKQIHALEKQVEDLMNYNTRAKIDITAYNKCILGMIEGKGPCGWCQEQNDCQREEKEADKGCSDWWIMDNPPVKNPSEGEDADEGQGILSSGPEGGE